MTLNWIEVTVNQFLDLETQQEVLLHDYSPQAARSDHLKVPPHYQGKVVLVTGLRQGNHIYDAKIRGSLS